jgi:hypothetical protein
MSAKERQSTKYRFIECLLGDTRQRYFVECQRLTLGKVNDRQLWTTADGSLPRVMFRGGFDTWQIYHTGVLGVQNPGVK